MPALSVVATDYDGTLTRTGRLPPEIVEALEALGAAGLRVVLVTGRQLADLREVCPEMGRLFHRVVAENGSVLATERGSRPVARPVDDALCEALAARGYPFVRGEVLLSLDVEHRIAVRQEIDRLGLDLRILLNKTSLMVLPASITKATGLSHALASLGASAEETLALGDGENDREMLELCAMGVAVSDAVDPLKAVADLVLDVPGGPAVAEYLRSLVPGGPMAPGLA